MRVGFGLCFENGVKGHELSTLQTHNFSLRFCFIIPVRGTPFKVCHSILFI